MMRAVALLTLLSAANAQPLPVCTGDFHGDGDVDVADVLTVLESFQVNADGDTDGNGVTDTVDLLNVLSQFGESCRATHGGSNAHGCTWIPPASRTNATTCSPSQTDTNGFCRWDCRACSNAWDWHMKCEGGGTSCWAGHQANVMDCSGNVILWWDGAHHHGTASGLNTNVAGFTPDICLPTATNGIVQYTVSVGGGTATDLVWELVDSSGYVQMSAGVGVVTTCPACPATHMNTALALADSGGDGWNCAKMSVTDCNGTTVASGITIPTRGVQRIDTVCDPFASPVGTNGDAMHVRVCLPATTGGYTMTVSGGAKHDEISWSVFENGNLARVAPPAPDWDSCVFNYGGCQAYGTACSDPRDPPFHLNAGPGVTPGTVSKTFSFEASGSDQGFEGWTGAIYPYVFSHFGWQRRNCNRGCSSPSGGTGPPSASDGNDFIYLETSSGAAQHGAGDYFVSPLYDSLDRLVFKYHMYGNDMGTLQVETCSSGCTTTGQTATTFSPLWSRSGQQNSANSAWKTADLTLPQGTRRVRFFGNGTGTTWHGDMALDAIVLFKQGVAASQACTTTVEEYFRPAGASGCSGWTDCTSAMSGFCGPDCGVRTLTVTSPSVGGGTCPYQEVRGATAGSVGAFNIPCLGGTDNCTALDCVGAWETCTAHCETNNRYIISQPALGGGATCPVAAGTSRVCPDGQDQCVVKDCIGSFPACTASCGATQYTITQNKSTYQGTPCPYSPTDLYLCNAVDGEANCPACTGLGSVSLSFLHSARSRYVSWTITAVSSNSSTPVCRALPGDYGAYAADQNSTNCCLTDGAIYTLNCYGGARNWAHATFTHEGKVIRCGNFAPVGRATFTASPSPPPSACAAGTAAFASMSIKTAGGSGRRGRQIGWAIKPLSSTTPTPTPPSFTVSCSSNWGSAFRNTDAATMVTADGACVGRSRYLDHERCTITPTGNFTLTTPYFNVENGGWWTNGGCDDRVSINGTQYCSRNKAQIAGISVTPATPITWYSDSWTNRNPGWFICSAQALAAISTAYSSTVTCESGGDTSSHHYIYSSPAITATSASSTSTLAQDFWAYGNNRVTPITDCCLTPNVTYELDCFNSKGNGWGSGFLTVEGTNLCTGFQSYSAQHSDGAIMGKTFRFGYGNVVTTGIRDICNVFNGDSSSCSGCVDPLANNTNNTKYFQNNSLCTYTYGCMDSNAVNYNPLAGREDGSCSCGNGYYLYLTGVSGSWMGAGVQITVTTCNGHSDANNTVLGSETALSSRVGQFACIASSPADNVTVTFSFPTNSNFQWHNISGSSGHVTWNMTNSTGGLVLSGSGDEGVHEWSTCDGTCTGTDMTLHLSDSGGDGWGYNGWQWWQSRVPSNIKLGHCPDTSVHNPTYPVPFTDPITLGRSGANTTRDLCLSGGEYVFYYDASGGGENQKSWWVTNGAGQNSTTAYVPMRGGASDYNISTCTDCAGTPFGWTKNGSDYIFHNNATVNVCGLCGVGHDYFQSTTGGFNTSLRSLYGTTHVGKYCGAGPGGGNDYRIYTQKATGGVNYYYRTMDEAMRVCALNNLCGFVQHYSRTWGEYYYLCNTYTALVPYTYNPAYYTTYEKTGDVSAWQADTCIGCQNSSAPNYDPTAAFDGGCAPIVQGPAPTCGSNVTGTITDTRGEKGRHYFNFTIMPGEVVGFSTCGSSYRTALDIAHPNGTVVQNRSQAPITYGSYGGILNPSACPDSRGFMSPLPAELLVYGSDHCNNPNGCTLLVVMRSYSSVTTSTWYRGNYILTKFCTGCMDHTADNYDPTARMDTMPNSTCVFANNTDCVGAWATCDTTCADVAYTVSTPYFGYGTRCAPTSASTATQPGPSGDTRVCNPGDGLCPNTPNCSLTAFGDHFDWDFRMNDLYGDGWSGAQATISDCNGTQLLPLPGQPPLSVPSSSDVYEFEAGDFGSWPSKWSGVGSDCSFGWQRNPANRNGRTCSNSASTGPPQASGFSMVGPHGRFGGHWRNGSSYIYLETSPGSSGSSDEAKSPQFTPGQYSSVEFEYHMNGGHMGTLKLMSCVTTTLCTLLWNATGAQAVPQWEPVSVALPPDATFVKFWGNKGSSWQGDMAVDRVRFSKPGTSQILDTCLPPSHGYTISVSRPPPSPAGLFSIPTSTKCRGVKTASGGQCLQVVGRNSDTTNTQRASSNYRDGEDCTITVNYAATLKTATLSGNSPVSGFQTEFGDDWLGISGPGIDAYARCRRCYYQKYASYRTAARRRQYCPPGCYTGDETRTAWNRQVNLDDINGIGGANGQNVTAGSTIRWYSDRWTNRDGWKICATGPGAPPLAPSLTASWELLKDASSSTPEVVMEGGVGTATTCGTCIGTHNISDGTSAQVSAEFLVANVQDTGPWADTATSALGWTGWDTSTYTYRWTRKSGTTGSGYGGPTCVAPQTCSQTGACNPSRPNPYTGPRGAAEGSHYLYVEASSGSFGSIVSLVNGNPFTDKVSVDFKYNMYHGNANANGVVGPHGTQNHEFWVETSIDASTWSPTGFHKIGSQCDGVDVNATICDNGVQVNATGWLCSNLWHEVSLPLPAGTQYVKFNAKRGSSWAGDTALDAVKLVGRSGTIPSRIQITACDGTDLGTVEAFVHDPGMHTSVCLPDTDFTITTVSGSIDWTLNINNGSKIVTGAAFVDMCSDCAGRYFPDNTATENNCGVCQATAAVCVNVNTTDGSRLGNACRDRNVGPYDNVPSVTGVNGSHCCAGAYFDFTGIDSWGDGWNGASATFKMCNGSDFAGSVPVLSLSSGPRPTSKTVSVCLPTTEFKVFFPSVGTYADEISYSFGPGTQPVAIGSRTPTNRNHSSICMDSANTTDCTGTWSSCGCHAATSGPTTQSWTVTQTASIMGQVCPATSAQTRTCTPPRIRAPRDSAFARPLGTRAVTVLQRGGDRAGIVAIS